MDRNLGFRCFRPRAASRGPAATAGRSVLVPLPTYPPCVRDVPLTSGRPCRRTRKRRASVPLRRATAPHALPVLAALPTFETRRALALALALALAPELVPSGRRAPSASGP